MAGESGDGTEKGERGSRNETSEGHGDGLSRHLSNSEGRTRDGNVDGDVVGHIADALEAVDEGRRVAIRRTCRS